MTVLRRMILHKFQSLFPECAEMTAIVITPLLYVIAVNFKFGKRYREEVIADLIEYMTCTEGNKLIE